MRTVTENAAFARLTPILVYIQTHLATPLPLADLAQRAGLSPYHFHRLFRDIIGETVKQYTLRLQLERAAFWLKIRDESILDIALSSGFQSHESFTRAFKRQLGVTPQRYRRVWRESAQPAENPGAPPRHFLNTETDSFALSAVSVQRLRPIPVAFIRHLGDYNTVDTAVYGRLVEWAVSGGMYSGDNALFGVGHDDPGVTEPAKLRFDACIQVPARFEPDGHVGFQQLPAGLYGTATYIGPFGPTLTAAHAAVFTALSKMRRYHIVGLPVIEAYRTTNVNFDLACQETTIFIPVRAA